MCTVRPYDILRVQDALVKFVYFTTEYAMCITLYVINNSNPKHIFHEKVIRGEEQNTKIIYIYSVK